jgi:uncharacterized protein
VLITDPAFYAVAIPAVLLVGFSKAGLAGGIASLGVPIMALAVAPNQAAAILLPILCVMDMVGIWAFRKYANWALLRIAIPAGCIGIALGTLLFNHVSPVWIKAVIGLEAVAFAAQKLWEQWRGQPAQVATLSVPKGIGWSALGGFTSFISHAGGPPMMQWLLPMKLDRMVFVGTMTWYFTVVNLVKLVPYSWLGLFDLSNLATSLALMPLVPVAYWVGLKFLKRIPDQLFAQIAVWCLGLVGIKLLVDVALEIGVKLPN